MRPATDTKSAAIETWIARKGLGYILAHSRLGAAQVNIGVPHRPHETLGALLSRQHDVAFLLAVVFQLVVIIGDGTAAGQFARRTIDFRSSHADPIFAAIAKISSADSLSASLWP